MSALAVAEHHVVTFEKFGRREFIGRCTCSATSGPVPYAGMVHGWEAGHLEDVRPAIVDPLSRPEALRRDAVAWQQQARRLSGWTREEFAVLGSRGMAALWQVEDAELYADARAAADRYREAIVR